MLKSMELLKLLEYTCVILSLTGNYFVVKKNRIGFIIWIFANIGWGTISIYHGLYGQCFLWLAYTVLAVWGFISWRIPNET